MGLAGFRAEVGAEARASASASAEARAGAGAEAGSSAGATASAVLAALLTSLIVGLALPTTARAGAQQYEELSAAVRSAMTAAATDPAVGEPIWDSRGHRIEWLAQMGARLPRRHFPRHEDRRDFLTLVRYEAQRAGLEPELVLGLIQVESAFRRHAISSAGALGYMQVMPFWTKLLADGNESQLFNMRTNIRYGCLILRHYLDIEKGDLFMALGRYNGSRGKDPYPNAVLAAWNRWRYVAPAEALGATAPAEAVGTTTPAEAVGTTAPAEAVGVTAPAALPSSGSSR